MISKIGMAARQSHQYAGEVQDRVAGRKNRRLQQGRERRRLLTVTEKLGIADAIKAKAVVVQGTSLAPMGAAIASGKTEIGVQLLYELLSIAGIDVISEIPAEFQQQIHFQAAFKPTRRMLQRHAFS